MLMPPMPPIPPVDFAAPGPVVVGIPVMPVMAFMRVEVADDMAP